MNTDSLHFYREGRARQLVISTDHPDGWTIEVPAGTQWVDPISQLTGLADSKDEVDVECETFIPGTPLETFREGYITVKAGRIRRNIKIHQVAEPELTIEVSPTDIVFRKSGSAKAITVKVYPENSVVYFLETPGTNPISWLTNYGPMDYNIGAANLGSYTIQPGVNTSNPEALLSSMITVYIMGDDGTPVGKNITLRQLATDLVFNVTHSNPYPATGGNNQVFFVESATDWYVASTQDPDGMLTGTVDNSTHAAGDNEPYYFNLTRNETFFNKYTTFGFGSTDPDFAGEDLVIEQGFNNPSMSLSTTSHQFTGTAPSSLNLAVNSTAPWSYSVDGNFANAATISTHSVNTEYGVVSPWAANTTNVTVTPKTFPASSPTPAAGTQYPGTVTVKTNTGNPSATEVTSTLNVTTVVPGYWTMGTFSPAGGSTVTGIAATPVTVTANTNAKWTATPTVGTAVSQGPSAYGLQTINTLSLPVNGYGWGDRNITVNVANEANSTVASATYTQKGYYVSSAARPASVAAAGGNHTVNVTGWFPASRVQVRAYGTNLDVSANVAAAGSFSGAGTGAGVLNIGASGWSSRSVQFYSRYSTTNGASWTSWAAAGTAITQPAQYNISSVTAKQGSIAATGGTVTIQVNGTHPGGVVAKASIGALNSATNAGSVTIGAGTNNSGTLSIGANTGTARTLYIQW